MHPLNPSLTAVLVFLCLVGAAGLGMRLQRGLPGHHLSKETKEAVRIGMGSVATMAALVLGLLVASTKQFYDMEKAEVVQMAAKVVHLDRLLGNYGPEAAEAREVLRRALRSAIGHLWKETEPGPGASEPGGVMSGAMPKAIQKLSPRDEAQRTFKAQAAQLANELGQTRWLLFEQAESSVSLPMIVIVVFWLALTFASVGLFAPANATATLAQVMGAVALAGAFFLILELDQPFTGLVSISTAPMLSALSHLGR